MQIHKPDRDEAKICIFYISTDHKSPCYKKIIIVELSGAVAVF